MHGLVQRVPLASKTVYTINSTNEALSAREASETNYIYQA